jgi:hypothetical protein
VPFRLWDLFPTIDHVMPGTGGGPDTEQNWVTTSKLFNPAKGNFTLEETSLDIAPG